MRVCHERASFFKSTCSSLSPSLALSLFPPLPPLLIPSFPLSTRVLRGLRILRPVTTGKAQRPLLGLGCNRLGRSLPGQLAQLVDPELHFNVGKPWASISLSRSLSLSVCLSVLVLCVITNLSVLIPSCSVSLCALLVLSL